MEDSSFSFLRCQNFGYLTLIKLSKEAWILQKILDIIGYFEHGKKLHEPGMQYHTICFMIFYSLVVPQAPFLNPFCSSVKTPLSSNYLYILLEIIPAKNFHIFNRHAMGR